MAVILSPRGNEASNMMKRFVRYEEAAQYFGIDESEGCLYEAVPGKQAGGEAVCFAKLYIWQWPDV